MAAKTAPAPDSIAGGMTEFGASGLRQFSGYVREEWLRDLQGWRGIRMIREMRDNDPIIGAVFFAIEMLLRGVPFRIEPADKTVADDVEAAAFVNSCMSDMEQSWPEFMAQALTFLQYGWSVHEIVYKFRRGKTKDPKTNSAYDDGMVGWRKFAGRAQETLMKWEFDEAGDATAMVQLLPTGGPLLTVPLSKCLHFVTVPLKNSPEGRSILRNAYVPYYRCKRIEEIEAIGIERDLAGLPIAWVPPELLKASATVEQKATLAALQKMVRDTARNEQEGFVFPLAYNKDGAKLFDFTLLSTGGRRQFDTVAIIDRYDQRKAASMLADFIVLGAGSQQGRGSFAQAQSKTGMFGDAVTSFLDLICAVFNMKGIPDLLEMNSLPGKVRMAHGDVTPSDITALGDYVSKLVGAAVLTADDGLEAHMREEAGLPDAENIGSRSLNEGGEASEGSGKDPAETTTDGSADAQERGDDASAPSDGVRKKSKHSSGGHGKPHESDGGDKKGGGSSGGGGDVHFDPSQARAGDGRWVETGAGDKSVTSVADLSQGQADALSVYKNGNYKKINDHLRKGSAADAKTTETIAHMDSALDRASLGKSQTLYRGMMSKGVYDSAISDPKSLIGKVMDDPGFMSTSTKVEIAASFNASAGIVAGKKGGVVFELKAKKGAKALGIDELGKRGKNTDREGEVLFGRNSRVKITGVSPKLWRGNVVIQGQIL